MSELGSEKLAVGNQEKPTKGVVLQPELKFAAKLTPIYFSEILDIATGEKVGFVEFQLDHRAKTIIISVIDIKNPRQGYGVSVYKAIQESYPDYTLESSDQMNKKDNEDQEKPNAVYLWEKLVKLGLAEKNRDGGFKMKKTIK